MEDFSDLDTRLSLALKSAGQTGTFSNRGNRWAYIQEGMTGEGPTKVKAVNAWLRQSSRGPTSSGQHPNDDPLNQQKFEG